MQPLIDFYKNSGNLHHAYFFVAHKVDEIVAKLKHFFENVVGIKTSGNPDFQHLQFKTLSIEEARKMAEAQERKDFSAGRKIFIIETDFITEEAQNALLKVFEEPTAGTHFFIVSPQDILLPTLRSRMHIIELKVKGERLKEESILKLKLPERLAKIKEMTEAIKDSDPSSQSYDEARKTKQDAIAFLNQIEAELYKNGLEKSAKALKICQSARTALYDRGAPIKMILEHLVLNI
ncbi:MAG: hypothetical protein HY507_01030 [Candidatus Zambryskibacteria bacterium]|nr:hypothetical protein [Candidatus Zambryskibacteria bacterium]